MGVLLGEAADIGVIIPRAEIVGLRLAVVVFAAIAEWIAIQRVRLLLDTERIVIVGSCAHPGAARQPGVFRAGGCDLLVLSAAYLEADTVNGSTLCCRCSA